MQKLNGALINAPPKRIPKIVPKIFPHPFSLLPNTKHHKKKIKATDFIDYVQINTKKSGLVQQEALFIRNKSVKQILHKPSLGLVRRSVDDTIKNKSSKIMISETTETLPFQNEFILSKIRKKAEETKPKPTLQSLFGNKISLTADYIKKLALGPSSNYRAKDLVPHKRLEAHINLHNTDPTNSPRRVSQKEKILIDALPHGNIVKNHNEAVKNLVIQGKRAAKPRINRLIHESLLIFMGN